jgi:DNA-binding winged helix-turn-helix (wHTH) protein
MKIMDEKKIQIVLSNEKLLNTLSELIISINKISNIKFQILRYRQNIIIKYPILVIDSESFFSIQKNGGLDKLKRIYLFKTLKDSKILKQDNPEFIEISIPFRISEFFERIINDFTQQSNKAKRERKFKEFIYDYSSRRLFNDTKSLIFTEKENEIFSCLLKYNQKPVSRNILLKDVWQYSDQIDTHTLETHIYSLRKKLEENLHLKNFLKHLKTGYRIDTRLL